MAFLAALASTIPHFVLASVSTSAGCFDDATSLLQWQSTEQFGPGQYEQFGPEFGPELDDWRGDLPQEPGCYRRMPTGCPRQAANKSLSGTWTAQLLDKKAWIMDVSGIKKFGAGLSRVACLKDRKKEFDQWCGTQDVEMMFLPGLVPAAPRTLGCYYFMPDGGREKHPSCAMSTEWKQSLMSADNREACMSQASLYDQECSIEQTKMSFVEEDPAVPYAPGCYAFFPAGCPRQARKGNVFRFHDWMKDQAGNKSEVECSARAEGFDTWCATIDVRMMYVPKYPVKPGCYAWMPNGCPKKEAEWGTVYDKYNRWRADEKGAASAAACEARAAEFNEWCGTNSSRTHFIPGEPSQP